MLIVRSIGLVIHYLTKKIWQVLKSCRSCGIIRKKLKEVSVITEQRKQINYTVALVSEFARKHRLSQQEAFEFLFTHRAIEFIKQNYDIEHTLSFEEALDDMMIICRNNGGVL